LTELESNGPERDTESESQDNLIRTVKVEIQPAGDWESKPIVTMSLIVREVWDYNLKEFSALMEASSKCDHCFVAMSTNFSGNIYTSKELSPYHLMKINVDATHIVQLGLAVSDANGKSFGFNQR
jgi:hypothetical protein